MVIRVFYASDFGSRQTERLFLSYFFAVYITRQTFPFTESEM